MRASIVIVALVACLALGSTCAVSAQAPIPYRRDGYQLGGAATAPVVLDAFFDLLCPDCAAAWPNVKDVIDYYGANLTVTMHTFPLPYHTWAFTAAQAAHVVLDAAPTQARAFADLMFTNQAAFWNGATAEMTADDVLAQLQTLVVDAKFSTEAAFSAGMANDDVNEETRVSWKYACSKAVLGTPTFFVNGVTVAADASWTLADWQFVLNPLFEPQPADAVAVVAKPKHAAKKAKKAAAKHAAAPLRKVSARSGCMHRSTGERTFARAASSCPTAEPSCQFLPGQFECCTPGEMCIPNVGCRC